MTEVSPLNKQQSFAYGFDSIINEIGDTPLLPIKIDKDSVSIYGKAEFFNPGGSVKDRPAWYMIKDGILNGDLDKNKTIVDASSGNTGIALAMIGSALGYDVTICIPGNASIERRQLIKNYGAKIITTDPLEGTDGAIEKVKELVKSNPDKYYYTDQYNNESNWKAHYETTGREILAQTDGNITHFVSGLGTSGTFRGITTYLRDEVEAIETIAVQPDSPFHGLEGLKHMESAITPGIYDPNLADSQLFISTDEAYNMTKWLAKEKGILVGISSGANVAAAFKIANKIDHGTIVTILCDSGERYLSDKFWSETDE